MSSIINIGIGIVIGVVVTIFIVFNLIKKPQVPGIPAIPTCDVGYTLEDDRCKSTKTIPSICPNIDGYFFEKHVTGACLRKCPSNTRERGFFCEEPGGRQFNRVETDNICPMNYTKKAASEEKCIDNNSKEPNYTCPNHHTLYKRTCIPVV
jgi:hypothetical protein